MLLLFQLVAVAADVIVNRRKRNTLASDETVADGTECMVGASGHPKSQPEPMASLSQVFQQRILQRVTSAPPRTAPSDDRSLGQSRTAERRLCNLFLLRVFSWDHTRSRARKNFYAAGVEWSGESHVTWVGLCDGLTGSDWGVDMTWCFCLAKLSLGLWHTGVQTRPKAYGSSIFFTKISKIELNI
jgi:hypothetical protein